MYTSQNGDVQTRAQSDTNARQKEGLSTRLCIEIKITPPPPDVLEDTPCITRAHAHGDINKLHWCSCLWREGYRAGERGLDGKAGKATERCLPRTLTGQQCFMNSGPVI